MPSHRKGEAIGDELGPPPKRRKDPGVRVIGGRIYDSDNGKTCHQCRQKTIDYMASCKSTARSKPCTRNYCAKCLLNRYGEIATDVSQLDDWSCPKCRGDCNCSICLKKQGKTPTGILTPTAKATGFSSVADLLKKCSNNDVEKLVKYSNGVKASEKNCLQTRKVKKSTGSSDENANRENSEDAARKTLLNHDSSQKEETLISSSNGGVLSPVSDKKKAKKTKGKEKHENFDAAQKKHMGEAEMKILIGTEEKLSSQTEIAQEVSPKGKKNKQIKDDLKVSCSQSLDQKSDEKGTERRKSNKRKSRGVSSDVHNTEILLKTGTTNEFDDAGSKHSLTKKNKNVKEINESGIVENPKNVATKETKKRRKIERQISIEEVDIDLPVGTPLMSISGMDFPTEAVGPALQLVEFCSAFRSVLGLRKGDAEAMLRELTKGRLARKGANSALVQFQAKLLGLIIHGSLEMVNSVSLSSGDGKSSWLHILKSHLAERSTVFMGLPTNKNFSKDRDLEEETTDVDDQMLDIAEDVADISESQRSIFAMSDTLKEDLNIIRDAIENGADGYENLGMYHKLQLLIMLCDDSLETEFMRNFIDSAHHEYWEARKGNREEVLAAKKEEKFAKQKMKNAAVASLLASANVATGSLNPEEKAALSVEVKAEAEKAVAAALLVKKAVSRLSKSRNDAVRTDPVVWAPDGRAFYKLTAVNDLKSVVLQDVGGFDVPERDRWFIYSEEEESVLSNFLQRRALQSRKKMRAFEEEKENLLPVYA